MKIDEYHQIELKEIMSRTIRLENLRVQILVFLGTANLTALGFALSNKRGAVFFFAALIMGGLALSDEVVRKWLIALYCRGLQLERKYAPDKDDALLATYLSVASDRVDLFERVSEIAKIKNPRDRNTRLRKIHTSMFVLWPLIIGVLEAYCGLFALAVMKWPFF